MLEKNDSAVSIRQITDEEFKRRVPNPAQIKVIRAGNVTEVYYTDRPASREAKIQKLDEDEFLVLSSGEVKEYQKSGKGAGEGDSAEAENRSMSPQSFKRSQMRLRRVINAIVGDRPELCKWLTLTYDQKKCGLVRDPETIYFDFQNFNRSLRRYLKKHDLGDYEYVSVVEPQRSGCWHFHVIQKWPDSYEKAPFVPLEAYMAAWSRGAKKGNPGIQNGSVDLKALNNTDNVGAYFSAYLGDAEVVEGEPPESGVIKEVEMVNPETGETERKRFIKGARVHYYPAGMNLYRCSKNVPRPTEEYVNPVRLAEILKEAGAEVFSTAKVLEVDDGEGEPFTKCMRYVQYNAKRKPEAADPREDVSEKPKEEDVNAFLQSCPVCGEMHDDGQVVTIGGKRKYVCLGCAEKLERPGADVGAGGRAAPRSDSGPAPSQGRSPRSAT